MRVLCTAGMLGALGSCGDSKTDDNGPMPGIKTITFSVSDLTAKSAKVAVAPSASDLGYYCAVMEKSEFDKLANDQACIQHILDLFRAQANSQSKPLADIISANTQKGNKTLSFDNLVYNKTYIAYAVGINPDGTVTSALFKTDFTTATPSIEQITITISEPTSSSAKVTYAPSDNDLGYFPSVMEKSEFAQFADDQACIKDVLNFLKSMVGGEMGTIEDAVNAYAKKGEQSHVFDKLKVGEEYIAYAVGVNPDGTASSGLFKQSFTVPVPGPSDNVISLEIKNLGADGAFINAMTTNKDPYVLDVWEASKLTGLSDEQIMDKVLNGYQAGFWEDNLLSGDDALDTRGRLEAATTYVAIAFGYEAGVKTTSLVKSEFTTKPGGWVECTFAHTQITLTSRNASYKITPSDDLVPYYFSLIPASKLIDLSDASLLEQLRAVIKDKINNGWGYSDLLGYGEKSQNYKELLPKTDYYLCAVGLTAKDEVITNVFKQKITTPDASSATVVFGTPQISGRSVTVSISGGANTPKWKASYIYIWSPVFTDDYMSNHLLNMVGENPTTLSMTVPENNTTANFSGIGIDANGNPGQVVTLKVPID